MAHIESRSVSVKVGDLEVIVSGVVHLANGASAKIALADLTFEFKFETDSGLPRYEAAIQSDRMVLTLFNHNNILGEGVFSPINLATINDKILYFTYFATTLPEGVRSFEYVLYEG